MMNPIRRNATYNNIGPKIPKFWEPLIIAEDCPRETSDNYIESHELVLIAKVSYAFPNKELDDAKDLAISRLTNEIYGPIKVFLRKIHEGTFTGDIPSIRKAVREIEEFIK